MVQFSGFMLAVAPFTAAGTLAVALKAISWVERNPISLPSLGTAWRFDSSSFLLGLLCGVCIYWLLDFWITLRWAVVQWVAGFHQQAPLVPAAPVPGKPLYKLL